MSSFIISYNGTKNSGCRFFDNWTNQDENKLNTNYIKQKRREEEKQLNDMNTLTSKTFRPKSMLLVTAESQKNDYFSENIPNNNTLNANCDKDFKLISKNTKQVGKICYT